jgi:hypothetical protein
MPAKVELFEFAKLIGAYIEFEGSYNPDNTYTNASLKQNNCDCFIDGWSVFGRSNKADDLDGACQDLAQKLTKAKTFQFRIGGGSKHDIHCPPLKHTRGYRPSGQCRRHARPVALPCE